MNIHLRMVSIRPSSRNGSMTTRFAFLAALAASFALSSVFFFVALPQPDTTKSVSDGRISESGGVIVGAREGAGSEEISPNKVMLNSKGSLSAVLENNNNGDEDDDDPMKITKGHVTYGNKNGGGSKTLSYYHCGPTQDSKNSNNKNEEDIPTELVMLHGAAFTKEDWKSSGILDTFCEINNDEDGGNLLLLALDLPVSVDGMELGMAFDSLASNRILSGNPAVFVSPSASGKAIVNLGETENELIRIVKAWIPVASGSVLKATDDVLIAFKTNQIPILAIHGDQDTTGKKVTERLENLANAKGVELDGSHPVYLDSPDEFVSEILQFLEESGL